MKFGVVEGEGSGYAEGEPSGEESKPVGGGDEKE